MNAAIHCLALRMTRNEAIVPDYAFVAAEREKAAVDQIIALVSSAQFTVSKGSDGVATRARWTNTRQI